MGVKVRNSDELGMGCCFCDGQIGGEVWVRFTGQGRPASSGYVAVCRKHMEQWHDLWKRHGAVKVEGGALAGA